MYETSLLLAFCRLRRLLCDMTKKLYINFSLFFSSYFYNCCCCCVIQMRMEMVQQKEGEMEITVLTHQDSMKRVALRTQK